MTTTSDDVAGLIAAECDALKAMLLAKNAAYGNSALEPMRVFSKAPVDEQIRVRLDDKLSRLARGSAAGEDVEADIMGYLVLMRVHRRLASGELRGDVQDAPEPLPDTIEEARDVVPKTLAEQVRDFQAMIGRPAPTVPTQPTGEVLRLRLRLIAEEFFELLYASLAGAENCGMRNTFRHAEMCVTELVALVTAGPDAPRMPEFADALADLDFVIEGTRQELGINGAPIADAVYRANMRKLGGPVDPATGKKLKPPGWAPPDIAGELRRQGW